MQHFSPHKLSRRTSVSALSVVAVVLAVAALPLHEAHAYLDPGTGSMVLQVVIAGILGAAFTLKSYVRAIFAPIIGIFRKTRTQSDA